MTKKEQKYIKSLKDENDGLRSLLIRFMDAVGKLTNIDDVVNMSLIPIMTEKTKRFKAEFKAEAYKECLDELARRLGYAFLSKHSCVLDIMENLLNELVGDTDGKDS
ncbi:MAG: transposase [Clostridia bacterium]|nr:transposase [Clostridia bacterium]